MSKWFTANKLALDLYKTNIIKFRRHNYPQYAISIRHKEQNIEETANTKFIVL